MAIDAISTTPVYQTMSVSQTAQTQPVTKTQSEPNATEGEIVQSSVAKPDETTAVVDASHKAAEDGAQSGGNNAQTPSEEAIANEKERLKKAVEDMNKKMSNSVAKYGIHEGTNRVVIKIVDKDTDKVIKELPPEKTLDMIAKAWELAGILVDEKR